MLGLVTSDDEMERYQRLIKLNYGDNMTFKAFKEIALSPSPLEEWVKSSVHFSRILTDALPKEEGCDYLRCISRMSADEIDDVVYESFVSVRGVLEQHVQRLRDMFRNLDDSASRRSDAGGCDGERSGSKFQVAQMTGGTIDDFYSGLDDRIGEVPAPWGFDSS